MKIKLLTPIFLFVLLSVPFLFSCVKQDPTHPHPPSDSTGVDLKKGLLVYLPFSGNYADSSGNNNPTAPLGGVTLSTDAFGRTNSAMASSGGWERVVVSNNGSIKFDSAFTFSANVLCRQQHDQTFVSMVKRATAQGVTFGLGYGIPGLNRVNFTVSNNNATCSDVPSDYNTTVDTSDLTMGTDTWYNLVVTFYHGTLKMYANGVLISTKTSNSPTVPICPGAELIVGGWWDGPTPQGINGKMDEVRLYNRALNAEEIAKLSQGFPVQAPPPVADLKRGLLVYLPFNGSIADSSGNNNPTQLVGSGNGLTYDIHGYANSAYGSDGTSGRLEVTNNGSIQFDTAFTVSLSFMERAISNNQVLASLVKTESGLAPTFLIGNSMVTVPDLWFGVTKGITCDQYGVNNSTDTTNFVAQPESWYNLVATFRKGAFKVYINGKLISQMTTSEYNAQVCPDAKLVIGGWWQNDPESINGKIDNFRLYNRVLSSDEIALLAQYYQPTTNSVRQVVTR